MKATKTSKNISLTIEEILSDYALAVESREASLIGRKEVFMGKAKFGIFGDGKEIAQIAKAKFFQNGDWRSGYYRDQTFVMAIGQTNSQEFFAQLYAHTDISAEPASGGRMMNGHFGSRSLTDRGEWKTLTDMKNTASDISCTAGQIPRTIGLAWASKLYRNNKELSNLKDFSIEGNEVAFGTIGNASTSEGHFWEAMNAAGVLQIPMVMSVWDDHYGISVPNEYHTTKASISKALAGLQIAQGENGIEIFTVKGWDYAALVETYRKAVNLAREKHIPSLIHVEELTQPQGHSTSGSHERYKSRERLDWEKAHDCNLKMRQWILDEGIADLKELEKLEKEAKAKAKKARDAAWKAYSAGIKNDLQEALTLIGKAALSSSNNKIIQQIKSDLNTALNPLKADIIKAVKKSLRYLRDDQTPEKAHLKKWLSDKLNIYKEQYNSHIISESINSPLLVNEVKPTYDENSKLVDGREIIQACFDALFARDPRVIAFGEDLGKIGDVNQGFAGLQDKYGEIRITDTSIRELSIIGQGIGTALRGLRPIAEIQYLDYIYYGLQTLTDDLACLHYRTKGGQAAPLIIRTRGHRLEGVWHSGSPMGTLLSSIRGIHILVPRNFTQAAGLYNTLIDGDDPAIVIESLNGYRLKEKMPSNMDDIRVPLGIPETLREGSDITLVTYGSMCRIVMEAALHLEEFNISCEVIDIQTLLPFDTENRIVESIKKTNRVAFIDEDVPGGASAFMMQNVLENQNAYFYLDSKPITISAEEHRPAYSTDGDYFSKPNTEIIFDKIYQVMHEADPERYKEI